MYGNRAAVEAVEAHKFGAGFGADSEGLCGSGGSTFSDLRSLCLVGFGGLKGFRAVGCYHRLVAEWIHFTGFGAISPTIKPKVCTFWGL